MELLPHAYLAPASSVAAALVLISLSWYVRRGARGVGACLPVLLVVAQPALFVLQESAEHAIAGHGLAGAAGSPAVRWGIALQLVAATFFVALSHLAHAAGRALRHAGSRPALLTETHRGPRPPTPRRNWTSVAAVAAYSERGPPTSFVPA